MDNLHSKHCAIQSQLNAPKDAFNPFGKYGIRDKFTAKSEHITPKGQIYCSKIIL